MDNTEIKKTIRREILQRRDAIPRNIKKEKDATIMHNITNLSEFMNAKTIFFYASFRSEVYTMDMIRIALNIGKSVVLPKVDKENDRLMLYEIKSMNEFIRGYMWIPEPSVDEDRMRGLADIDLIIIPGAAFDTHGNRLGYGAGFYDKLLAGMEKRISIIAPAYEEQIVGEIPAEMHDIRVDKIITDKRVIDCSQG